MTGLIILEILSCHSYHSPFFFWWAIYSFKPVGNPRFSASLQCCTQNAFEGTGWLGHDSTYFRFPPNNYKFNVKNSMLLALILAANYYNFSDGEHLLITYELSLNTVDPSYEGWGRSWKFSSIHCLGRALCSYVDSKFFNLSSIFPYSRKAKLKTVICPAKTSGVIIFTASGMEMNTVISWKYAHSFSLNLQAQRAYLSEGVGVLLRIRKNLEK